MPKDDTNKNHVRAARSRAGKARAAKLPSEQRSEISRKAALSRWDPNMPFAEHESGDHPLLIGNIELACYVLNDGTRAFSQRGLLDALELGVRGGRLEAMIETLTPYLDPDVAATLRNPLLFRRKGGGPLVHGSPATSLVDLCSAILTARDQKTLDKAYADVAIRADVIVRAVAKVGIIALVDEATGYTRTELLQTLLQKFLREELARWTKLFPDEFYEQIFRLRRWAWRGRQINPPGIVAYYTKDFVYARLTPGILEKLERLNPKVGKYRRHKHTQFLTEDFGVPALNQHLATVLTFMRGSSTWDEFKGTMDKFLPRHAENLKLPLLEWGKEQVSEEDE